MAKGKLSKDAQMYVVMQLAMWERPTIIRDQLKELFDVAEISLSAIVQYDAANPKLSPKWKSLFKKTRAKFIEDTNAIPIANKAFRLRELDSLYHRQKLNARAGNPVEMRAVLEQAAKESGNQYSNVRELTGKGGTPLIPDNPARVVVYLPDNARGDSDAAPVTAHDAESGVDD
jgi:hypothetical protein